MDHTIVLAVEQFVKTATGNKAAIKNAYPINGRDADDGKIAALVGETAAKLGRPIEHRRNGNWLTLQVNPA